MALPVEAEIDDHAVKPRLESRLGAPVRRIHPHAEHRLLQDLVGIGRIREHASRQGQRARGMAGSKSAKRSLVAHRHASHQRLVGRFGEVRSTAGLVRGLWARAIPGRRHDEWPRQRFCVHPCNGPDRHAVASPPRRARPAMPPAYHLDTAGAKILRENSPAGASPQLWSALTEKMRRVLRRRRVQAPYGGRHRQVAMHRRDRNRFTSEAPDAAASIEGCMT